MINLDKFLMFILILVLDQNHSVNSNVYPVKADLPIYLRALERIIGSAGKPYNLIDGNFGLGLFLANVNIKSAILRKNSTIPKSLQLQLDQILADNKVSLNFFGYVGYKYDSYENADANATEAKGGREIYRDGILTMTEVNTADPTLSSGQIITHSDEDLWSERLTNFFEQPELDHEEIDKEYLFEKYSQWSWYERRVLDFENSVPSPAQSDACMISLALNKVKRFEPSYTCSTAGECLNFVEHGSDFGYALVHRVLFLLVAHYGRGCYAFTPELDDAFIDKLCADIYEEANYIAWNKFQSPDLLMEQISTCSLAGHTRFLQRKWLSRLMKQQTRRGCFSTYLNTVYSRLHKKELDCNGHVSGVAAAALGAVIRYIIETFF